MKMHIVKLVVVHVTFGVQECKPPFGEECPNSSIIEPMFNYSVGKAFLPHYDLHVVIALVFVHTTSKVYW